jgi:hypothetical protein
MQALLGLHTMIMFSVRTVVREFHLLGITGGLHPRHCHAAMGVLPASHVHTLHTHAHIGHRAKRSGPTFRDLRAHARARRERAARIAATVHGLGKDGVCPILGRFDDYIVDFCRSHAQFVYHNRLDILPINLHHRHRETGDAHVVESHTGRVDKSQTHSLARTKQSTPVAGWRQTIHQIGVRVAGNIREIGRVHPHPVPTQVVLQRGPKAHAAHIRKELAGCAFLEVVIAPLFLEIGEQRFWRFEAPIREHHHIVTLVAKRLRLGRVDDHRAIDARLLLQARVAVVPIGATLTDGKLVNKGGAWLDAAEAHPRHAVHVWGEEQSVPVKRRVFLQTVRNA